MKFFEKEINCFFSFTYEKNYPPVKQFTLYFKAKNDDDNDNYNTFCVILIYALFLSFPPISGTLKIFFSFWIERNIFELVKSSRSRILISYNEILFVGWGITKSGQNDESWQSCMWLYGKECLNFLPRIRMRLHSYSFFFWGWRWDERNYEIKTI